MAVLHWITALALSAVVLAAPSGDEPDVPSLRGAGKQDSDSSAMGVWVNEDAARPAAVDRPADQWADTLATLAPGESLVECRGAVACRGGWYWVGGVRKCHGALYCSTYAVVLGTGDAESETVASSAGGTPEASTENDLTPEDLDAMSVMAAEASMEGSAKPQDVDAIVIGSEVQPSEEFQIPNLAPITLTCRGVMTCRSWGWVGGRKVCHGGLYCRPW